MFKNHGRQQEVVFLLLTRFHPSSANELRSPEVLVKRQQWAPRKTTFNIPFMITLSLKNFRTQKPFRLHYNSLLQLVPAVYAHLRLSDCIGSSSIRDYHSI